MTVNARRLSDTHVADLGAMTVTARRSAALLVADLGSLTVISHAPRTDEGCRAAFGSLLELIPCLEPAGFAAGSSKSMDRSSRPLRRPLHLRLRRLADEQSHLPADQTSVERLRQAQRSTTSATSGASSRTPPSPTAKRTALRDRTSATTSPPAWTPTAIESAGVAPLRPDLDPHRRRCSDRKDDRLPSSARCTVRTIGSDGTLLGPTGVEQDAQRRHESHPGHLRPAASACPTATTM